MVLLLHLIFLVLHLLLMQLCCRSGRRDYHIGRWRLTRRIDVIIASRASANFATRWANPGRCVVLILEGMFMVNQIDACQAIGIRARTVQGLIALHLRHGSRAKDKFLTRFGSR